MGETPMKMLVGIDPEPFLRIKKHGRLFRIHFSDGEISDLKNLTWAKDCAVKYARSQEGNTRISWTK